MNQIMTQRDALDLVDYDPGSGEMRWRRNAGLRGSIPAGTLVGGTSRYGYRVFVVGEKPFFVHRVAWLIQRGSWPTGFIDHINGRRDDNRFANLREADASQNQANRNIDRRNTSGVKGVTKHRTGKWQVSIQVSGRKMHLGLFSDIENAAQAYACAAAFHFNEFGKLAKVEAA